VAQFDPPNLAQVAANSLALLKDGIVTKETAIDGLTAIAEELRKTYEISALALQPIEDLISELRSRGQESSFE
jgi:hypothetical protein